MGLLDKTKTVTVTNTIYFGFGQIIEQIVGRSTRTFYAGTWIGHRETNDNRKMINETVRTIHTHGELAHHHDTNQTKNSR